jgi:polysaccharide export outer membrane protein
MRTFLALAVFCVVLATGVTAQTASYRLQPGDTVEVSVWQDEKLNRQVVVRPDGMISFPLAGQIRAGGQTLVAVEQALKQRLQGKYTSDLDVTVALATLATRDELGLDRFIYVTGEVNKPGQFDIGRRGINVLQAIALSGGFGPYAATSRILVQRRIKGEEVSYLFNYDEIESGRGPGGNMSLRAGDVVIVPERGFFE